MFLELLVCKIVYNAHHLLIVSCVTLIIHLMAQSVQAHLFHLHQYINIITHNKILA